MVRSVLIFLGSSKLCLSLGVVKSCALLHASLQVGPDDWRPLKLMTKNIMDGVKGTSIKKWRYLLVFYNPNVLFLVAVVSSILHCTVA